MTLTAIIIKKIGFIHAPCIQE